MNKQIANRNLHNTVISYNDIKRTMPDRTSYLIKQESEKIDKSLNTKKPILFLPTYLMETSMQDIKYQKALYKIILMGILTDGRRINVIIDGVEPYFEVRIKDGTKEEQKAQVTEITKILAQNDITIPIRKELIKAKPFKYYQENKSWFLRLFYRKAKDRQIAIDAVRKQGHETATDDKNSYYRVVCRDHETTFSSWALLTDYRLDDVNSLKGDCIRVNIENYKKVELELFSKIKVDPVAANKETKTNLNNNDTIIDAKKKAKKLDECKKKQIAELRRIKKLDTCPEYKQLFSDRYLPYLDNTFIEMTANQDSYSILDTECENVYQTLLKDKTMSCCWDIETWSKSGELPQPENLDDCIFCLSMTFQWVNEQEPFLKICLCDYPASAKAGYITIVCGTEQNILKAFAEIFARMRPEFIFGFNDSDYDWNWVIKRAAQQKGMLLYISKCMDSTIPYKVYSESEILSYNYKKEHVKVEADTYVDGASLMMAGYIPVDVRTIFRKLYPTAESSSLKWFLEKEGLGGKEDMPYERIFAIYREYREFMQMHLDELVNGNDITKDLDTDGWNQSEISKYNELKTQLRDVNSYCVVDSLACHNLIKKRCVVMDHREVSNLSFVSVYDAFYRANGMKVRNLTIAEGQLEPFCIRFSNISGGEKSDEKYPGAYVFPPKKGLKISKLDIDERCKKAEITRNTSNKSCQEWLGTTDVELTEYKSIITKYGAVLNDAQISDVEKDIGKQLPKKLKDFLKEPVGRPITGLDFASLYPSLIRAYNFSPDYCILATTEGRQKAKDLVAAGHKLTRVCFDFGLDIDASKPAKRLAYFVWHNNEYEPFLKNENGDILIINDKKAINPNFRFGVYPYILNRLFDKRNVIKDQMKDYNKIKEEIEAMSEEEIKAMSEEKRNAQNIRYEEINFQSNYLNSKQNALKVFMNTFYGEAGNQISPFFVLEVAGGITTYGQKNIIKAQKYVEENECGVHYGDSVAKYTPILFQKDGDMIYCEIQDLVDKKLYKRSGDKEIAKTDGIKIWSDAGWTKVKHIIRHKTNKQMYRVMTHCALVDVTEDHSLLDDKANKIKPDDCSDKCLLTKELPKNHFINLFTSKNEIYKSRDQIDLAMICQDLSTKGIEYSVLCDESSITIDTTRCDDMLHSVMIDTSDATNHDQRKQQNKVKKIIMLPPTNDYVYDIETENHHFSAGIGNLVVHNTDSLYISAPEKHFINVDKSFYSGKINKLDYWTEMVMITMGLIDSIRDGVNKMFIDDNGTVFLKMAYEEVLYPVAFTAKKKYFGIPHEHIPNFKPKKLFIRGLEVKKRGVSGLLKQIFTELMWVCVGTENIYDLIELVRAKIDEIYNRKWKLVDFIQTGVYRTNKQNVRIKTFVERMKQKGIIVKPNERFNYVTVKQYPFSYDARGRKTALSAGDKIELVEVAEKYGQEIDLDYYMQGSVNGQLARLITYHPMFQEEPSDYNDDEEVKKAEKKTYKNACKYVDEYCGRYYSKYNTFGKSLQKIFRTANKAVGSAIKQTDDLACDLLSANVSYDDFEAWFVEFAEKKADRLIDNHGKEFVVGELNKAVACIKEKHKKEKAAIEHLKYKKQTDHSYQSDEETNERKKTNSSYKLARQNSMIQQYNDDPNNDDEISANFTTEYYVDQTDHEREQDDYELLEHERKEHEREQEELLREQKQILENQHKSEIAEYKKQKLRDMQKAYYGGKTSIREIRTRAYNETMSILRKKIRENYDSFMSLYMAYNKSLQSITDMIKSKMQVNEDLKKPTTTPCDFKLEDFDFEIDNELESEVNIQASDQANEIFKNNRLKSVLDKLKTLYIDIVAARITFMRTENIVDYLKQKRNTENRMIVRPDQQIIKNMISQEVADNKNTIVNLAI